MRVQETDDGGALAQLPDGLGCQRVNGQDNIGLAKQGRPVVHNAGRGVFVVMVKGGRTGAGLDQDLQALL
jgi:hypothetical protein